MDDSDDPVMAPLATQRAVLAAVENLATQVEAMQAKVDAMGETLAQFVAGSAGASGGRRRSRADLGRQVQGCYRPGGSARPGATVGAGELHCGPGDRQQVA